MRRMLVLSLSVAAVVGAGVAGSRATIAEERRVGKERSSRWAAGRLRKAALSVESAVGIDRGIRGGGDVVILL